jgi:YfiR/HmsC-like
MALFKFRFVLVLCAFTAEELSAQTADEYQVKAAFLYNFAKFVEWPSEAFKLQAAERERLRISSRLLNLAQIVKTK